MIYLAVEPSPERGLGLQRRETIKRYFAAIQTGDYAVLQEVLTPDAITRWPQSGERISGAMSCVRVYQNYPGGPPSHRLERISGDGDVWVAELVADYGKERWHTVSVIEFDGRRIARMTDYFGPSFPAPEWRQEWVQREDSISQ
jgi:ketosteroid isomerase-like protein